MLIKCSLIFSASSLRDFENSFLTVYIGNRPKNNNWITKGIRLSCTRKRELYILCKNTNILQVKNYYKKYCTILKKVITEGKTIHFNNYIKQIVKNSTGQSQLYDSVAKINSEAGLVTGTKERVSFFSKFFIQIAENFNNKYISLHKSLQLLEKANMNEIVEMKLIPVPEIEVINTVTSLKRKSAAGYEVVFPIRSWSIVQASSLASLLFIYVILHQLPEFIHTGVNVH